jgi:hypothetical protein
MVRIMAAQKDINSFMVILLIGVGAVNSYVVAALQTNVASINASIELQTDLNASMAKAAEVQSTFNQGVAEVIMEQHLMNQRQMDLNNKFVTFRNEQIDTNRDLELRIFEQP